MAMNYGKSGANKILKKVAENNDATQNAKVIVDIPIELIDVNPDNILIFNMDGIEKLANEIKEHGFSGGIEVLESENGRYEVIAGHRRFEAVKLLGWDKIPCIIYKQLDEISKADKLISSNIFNREMSPLDWARAIEYYKKKVLKPKGVKNIREECRKKFQISESSLLRMERILRLAPSLQEIMSIQNFPYTVIVLSEVYKYPVEVQDTIAEQIKEYISTQDVQEREQISFVQIKTIVTQNLSKYERSLEDKKIEENLKKARMIASTDAQKSHMVNFDAVNENVIKKENEVQSFSSSGFGNAVLGNIESHHPDLKEKENSMETELKICIPIMERAKNFAVSDVAAVKSIISRLKKTLEEIENEI